MVAMDNLKKRNAPVCIAMELANALHMSWTCAVRVFICPVHMPRFELAKPTQTIAGRISCLCMLPYHFSFTSRSFSHSTSHTGSNLGNRFFLSGPMGSSLTTLAIE